MECVSRARIVGLILLGASLLLVNGCGYKNNPVPPESVVPKPVNDLRYAVNDKGVKLDWFYPVETVIGTALSQIDSFELFRAEIPVDDYCGNCPIPFAEPLDLPGGAVLDGETRRRGAYSSSLLKSGHKYFFKVRSRASWWASSSDSNIVTFVWFEPAAAPKNVQAVAKDRRITLSWTPVTTRLDGQPLKMDIKYQVLRRGEGKEFEPVGTPIASTMFEDRQVRNGQKYFYTVQSMLVYESEFVNGGVSEEIASTPVDQSPPVAPAGVTAVWSSAGVKIFWDRSSETDIGGYRVYRRASDKDDYELVGNVDPAYSLFVDSKIDENTRYYWAVTAIDQAKPANESHKSREATIRY